jgi:hypothetical protein
VPWTWLTGRSVGGTRMRRIVAVLGVACAVTLTGGPPAQAITGDAVPDEEHPYVGVVIVYDANGEPVKGCSGSLLTDTVFLTAGHCVTSEDPATQFVSARTWFEQDAGADYDPATGSPATRGFQVSGGVQASTFQRYGTEAPRPPQTFDAGLVILDEPVTTVYPDLTEYASLAEPGTLEDYMDADPEDATMTISGYGASESADDPGQLVDGRSRLTADTDIAGLNTGQTGEFNVELAGADENGDGGGACFGDSGGPLLLQGTDVITGVISTGNSTCTGPFLSYRADTEAVLDWILETADSEADEIDVANAADAS